MAGSLVSKGNNKWELRISNGYDENKKQRRVTKIIYAKTKTPKAIATKAKINKSAF